MRSVWFAFKLFEGCLGCLCMGIQIEGFLNVAVSQDLYLYITVFSVFTCTSFFGCLNICMENDPVLLREIIWSSFASFSYIITGITTMYHAEKDLYLMYLSDLEIIEDEMGHQFFGYSKTQTILAIVTSVVYLLHAVLAGDMLISETAVAKAAEGEEKKKLLLYLGGMKIHNRLLKLKWFRRFDGRMRPTD
ncbi:PREDICTED: uncharacterized protein LOC108971069 [Bactrocera latifrons]|uniref:DUF7775 domain-containing protein n=1 Tax=Bactrocera latifrons TaxID=174628 RepID=A0A0K8VL16_BACLA|nr:PREDICTED: uncharacterized protein LOC108971069 [Bactrocera latifrons]